jgi:hypothetical protein
VSQESTNRSFDDLARALAEGSISRRRALKLFAGTAIAALIPSQALAQEKVTICHKPGTPDQKTIEVSQRALRSHQAHGDTLGGCTTTTTSTTETPTTTTTAPPCGGGCTAGTAPCCPSNPFSVCYDNANGMGTTCACLFRPCIDDCSSCSGDDVCVSDPFVCGSVRCVFPC